MRKISEVLAAVRGIDARLQRLENDSEVMKTVLIVKEPGTPVAAAAFDGLRKQVLASAGERRAHLTQLAQLHAALRRSLSVDDALLVVDDWMVQAGVTQVWSAGNHPLRDHFEVLDGAEFAGEAQVEVVDPAYVDASGALLRLGRVRLVHPAPAVLPPAPGLAAPAEGFVPADAPPAVARTSGVDVTTDVADPDQATAGITENED